MIKVALITDVKELDGTYSKELDGTYSNELLLGKSYVVHGVRRHTLFG